MKIDDIHNEWVIDGHVDITNITHSAAQIPMIHNKYYRWYVEENLRLKKYRADLAVLKADKTEWLRGEMDSETIRDFGWKPNPKKIMKGDIPLYLESDQDIINLSLKIGMQEEICQYLESIIRQINNRGYLMKTIVDYEKFKNGM